MRTSKTKFVAIGILVCAVVAIACLRVNTGPPLSLAVVGYTTNQYSSPELSNATYVCAMIAVTNVSKKTLMYEAVGLQPSRVRDADYRILHRTADGWKEPYRGLDCGMGMIENPLLPSQWILFEAIIPTDEPCKVAFDYWPAYARIWDKAPDWLFQKLPWVNDLRTATTEVIDSSAR